MTRWDRLRIKPGPCPMSPLKNVNATNNSYTDTSVSNDAAEYISSLANFGKYSAPIKAANEIGMTRNEKKLWKRSPCSFTKVGMEPNIDTNPHKE
jgi:hypothetical protein